MADESTTPSGVVTSDDIAATAASLAGADSSSAQPAPAEEASPATTAPVSEGAEPTSEPGPIPFDRHKSALENARAKAAQDAEAALRAKLGWAERYAPDEVANATQMLQWVRSDPQGFMRFLKSQVPEEAAPEQPPAPDLKAEDGTLVYSAPQMQKLLDFQQRQWRSAWERDYGPTLKAVQEAQMTFAAGQEASAMLAKARAEWPRFSDLEADIKRLMVETPALGLQDAYIQAFKDRGVKMLEEGWKSQYTGTLEQKAAAGTTRPTQSPARTRKPVSEQDVRDLAEQVHRDLSRR